MSTIGTTIGSLSPSGEHIAGQVLVVSKGDVKAQLDFMAQMFAPQVRHQWRLLLELKASSARFASASVSVMFELD
ncbi:hypothetical protein AVDCRST_MAG94-3397 [uncultured Leptolyngbya sp.]|uniref:Uncharacterized protein n=1 Tax=uncultured Leptolyngbya sp. TaxID=332963 RepID=A0A6J4MJM0_9CYAN|nr:hypothetical protein AVDCRST_MAG94-3397 [uncultured Leptolyngbya sp.]